MTLLGEPNSGGYFESVTYDDRDATTICFFVSEDRSDGALRRFCQDKATSGSPDDEWDVLHKVDGYTRDYLVLYPATGTFEWTSTLATARSSASAYYPNVEGLEQRNGYLIFVSKVLKRLFILNLDNSTYVYESTDYRLFSGDDGSFNSQPDQIKLITGQEVLYFTEDGGSSPGIYVRDNVSGKYGTIFEAWHSRYNSDETTGLAFSPDGTRMYSCIQHIGHCFEFTREDGRSFGDVTIDRQGTNSGRDRTLDVVDDGSRGGELTLGLKFHG